MITRRSSDRYGNFSSVADAENHRTSYTLLSTNFGRHQQRNSPAFVLAVNLEIVMRLMIELLSFNSAILTPGKHPRAIWGYSRIASTRQKQE